MAPDPRHSVPVERRHLAAVRREAVYPGGRVTWISDIFDSHNDRLWNRGEGAPSWDFLLIVRRIIREQRSDRPSRHSRSIIYAKP
jgi:hypothetical protein